MMFCRNCVCCQRLWPLRSALVWSRACVAQSTCLASQWSTNLRWQLWLAVDSSDRWFDPGCWLGSGFQSQLEQLVSSLFQNPISFGRLTEAKYYHCFLLGLRANNFNPILIFPQCVCVCVCLFECPVIISLSITSLDPFPKTHGRKLKDPALQLHTQHAKSQ